MSPIVLFVLFTLLIAGALLLIWRYWNAVARVSPEEEAFDERMTALNDRQANRLSDDQLTHPLNDDDAWSIMVQRGRRDRERRRRPPRPTQRRLAPPREDRYGGELSRRVDERRRRTERSDE
ncbi:MAG TPA: hypothetical protein VKE41_03215 [Roseiflexaceae bacterium]|nr:hypothetical protein [Roseiflexaceae bacterium]